MNLFLCVCTFLIPSVFHMSRMENCWEAWSPILWLLCALTGRRMDNWLGYMQYVALFFFSSLQIIWSFWVWCKTFQFLFLFFDKPTENLLKECQCKGVHLNITKVYTKNKTKNNNRYLQKNSLKTKLSAAKTIYEGQQWEISHF